jgi:hypothetical protein
MGRYVQIIPDYGAGRDHELLVDVGPGGIGTEDPDNSMWCTQNAETCYMIVREGRVTVARLLKGSTRKCRYPVGTCMLWPQNGLCKYISGEEGDVI